MSVNNAGFKIFLKVILTEQRKVNWIS